MTKLFLYLANRSITAGFLILAVIGLRFLFRKLPKGPQLLLWALVALRLAVPVSLESAWSLLPKSEPISAQVITDTTTVRRSFTGAAIDTTAPTAGTVSPAPIISELSPASTPEIVPSSAPTGPESFFGVCAAVWLLGTAAMLAYCLVTYGRLKKRLSVCMRLEGCVYICDAIRSPFVLGLVHPRIYLPSDLSQEARTYVLAHERAHLRHGDAWWKLLGYALLSVYWFHPLVWAAYYLFCRDLEMACDERAIKGMDTVQKKNYACTLLLCAAPKGSLAVCPVAFSQNSVKQRIANILQRKTAKIWVLVIACALAIGILWCFATDPKAPEPGPSPADDIMLDSTTAAEAVTVPEEPEDQAAYQFMQAYLDAAAKNNFDHTAEYIYFPNEGVYAMQKAHYSPGVHTIDSWRRINPKLWAFDILYDGFEEPYHMFVGVLDGEKKVIQHVDDVPQALRENLVASEFDSDLYMHESSEIQQIQYELHAFRVPSKVECFQMENVQPSYALGNQPSFADVIFSTDVWSINENYSRAMGPELYTTGCRITSYDGRSVVIRKDCEGFDLYNADGTWSKQILGSYPGFSGSEILAYIRNWALEQEANPDSGLYISSALVLDQESGQVFYPLGKDYSVEAGKWGQLALAIAAVQAVPDPEGTIINVPVPSEFPYNGGAFYDVSVLNGLTVQDHLYRMLLWNEADSTYALVHAIWGSEEAAVAAMGEIANDASENPPYFWDPYDGGVVSAGSIADLVTKALEYPLLKKIWQSGSYTIPSTGETVYSRNALLPANPMQLSHTSQDSRVTGGLAHCTRGYADMAVTAEYRGRQVLCIVLGAQRISHRKAPDSYDIVDRWGNYEEMEKLLDRTFE